MKTRFLALLCALCVVLMASMVACSSDDSPSAQAGNGGSGAAGSGGQAGSTAQGGSSGTAGGGGTSTPGNPWQKGVVGKANKGAVMLAQNAGQIQGFSVYNAQKTTSLEFRNTGSFNNHDSGHGQKVMDLPTDGGDLDADPDAEVANSGGVGTVPSIDLSGITPDFSEMWFPIPAYKDMAGNPTVNPLTAVLKPDGAVSTISHFPDWATEFKLGCFSQTFDTNINQTPLKSFAGWSWDMVDCLNRHFLVSNGSNRVYELFPDGTRSILTESLPDPGVPSSIMCHPEGFLVVTLMPGYAKNAPNSKPLVGVKLAKITLDNQPVVSLIAELPISTDYAPQSNFTSCWSFTHTTRAIPTGLHLPLAIKPDLSYLVGDVGARKAYSVSADGQTVSVFADMPQLTASLIYAPNGILYMVESPVLNKTATQVLQGTTIRAFDGTDYTDILQLDGYDQYINTMSWGMYGATCPPKFASEGACKMPFGVFIKISNGATMILYVMDPIKGQFVAIPLDTEPNDAGADAEPDSD